MKEQETKREGSRSGQHGKARLLAAGKDVHHLSSFSWGLATQHIVFRENGKNKKNFGSGSVCRKLFLDTH
jgi:hypothetical protein